MGELFGLRTVGVAGRQSAGKDTFYEHVLKPRGFIRWQMTMHYKVWLVSAGRFTWEEVFETKPKPCRKALQEEITELRYGLERDHLARYLQDLGPGSDRDRRRPVRWHRHYRSTISHRDARH